MAVNRYANGAKSNERTGASSRGGRGRCVVDRKCWMERCLLVVEDVMFEFGNAILVEDGCNANAVDVVIGCAEAAVEDLTI